MNIKSLYNKVNYNIILLTITIIDSFCILGAYKNGSMYYD